MLSSKSAARIDAKRRALLDSKKRQFAKAQFEEQDYGHRLNFYTLPPTGDIALEQFEEWGIARLKVLAELESCQFRNRTTEETLEYMRPILTKYLPLSQNSSKSAELQEERKRDHYSHWTLRLAFSATEDLRKRFARLESQLFKIRMNTDDVRERREFIESLNMSWETVTEEEKKEFGEQLKAATGVWKDEEEDWFKVDFERVPELVESRRVLLKRGKAFVHVREQTIMIANEFSRQLENGLELAVRALPRLDEDDRLSPILNHLSKSFTAPEAIYSADAASLSDMADIRAETIDALSKFFPLCMQNLHRELRQNSHLKHYGRLQYTLFLKGIGMDMNECIRFWRTSFKLMNDEKFKKDYVYNIKHAYGEVGGDSNKRGRGYSPYNCQKLLTEALPGPGQTHGCPYRSFNADNLVALLQSTGVTDKAVLKEVREDVGKQRYHIACNKVFESTNKEGLKKVKDESLWSATDLDTILHPNTYFKRAWMLSKVASGDAGVVDPGSQAESQRSQ